MRFLPGAMILFVAASCAQQPPPRVRSDAAKNRLLMGRNERLKLEIQQLTANPDPDSEIHPRIDEMIQRVREAKGLRPFKDGARNDLLPGLSEKAIADLEGLRAAHWTPQTSPANWTRLETACATCHTQVR